ncbi:LCP family protein [Glycomyces harbinensis]|uniref:Transcriptional attenuator, LytR family n=1 Tax=Glycomyces harbinensis TaxID=58114 RepID=A0A1G6YTC9_9ACTN|nr:LCP family protein [Glycomyces harbinensis]SDD93313.1 transcriptional attenuator, LytR family [Glycomyces harbinensis]
MAGKSGAPWWAHLMMYAGGLTLVVAGGAAAAAQIALDTANNAVESEEILGDAQAEVVADIQGPLNILVLGVDKQGGSTRSDTMIMVHINEDLTDVSMVSLPRDLWVDIPDCGPDWGNDPCEFKLNHAASISDDWETTRPNVVNTIYDLTGVQFHIGATVDFNGFLELVDLVGEIELCPWHEITSHHGDNKVFPEGCAYYDKKDSLDLIRQRYGWNWDSDWEEGRGGDYGRQAMQQQAIRSLITELKADGYHKDPTKLNDILSGFGDSLTMQLPEEWALTDLVVNLRDINPDDITSIQVPSTAEEIDYNGEPLSIVRTHEGEEQTAADALWEALQTDTLDQWIAANPKWVKDSGAGAGETAGDAGESPTAGTD